MVRNESEICQKFVWVHQPSAKQPSPAPASNNAGDKLNDDIVNQGAQKVASDQSTQPVRSNDVVVSFVKDQTTFPPPLSTITLHPNGHKQGSSL